MLSFGRRVLALPLEPSTGIRKTERTIKEPVPSHPPPIGLVAPGAAEFLFKRNTYDMICFAGGVETLFQANVLAMSNRRDSGRSVCEHLAADYVFRVDRSGRKNTTPIVRLGTQFGLSQGGLGGSFWSARPCTVSSDRFQLARYFPPRITPREVVSTAPFLAILTYDAWDLWKGYTPGIPSAIGAYLQTDCRKSWRGLPRTRCQEQGTTGRLETYWRIESTVLATSLAPVP